MNTATWTLRIALKGGDAEFVEGLASSDEATEVGEQMMRERREIDTIRAYAADTDPAEGDCAMWLGPTIVWAIPESRLYP